MEKRQFVILVAVVVVLLGLGAYWVIATGPARAARYHAQQGSALFRNKQYAEAVAAYSKSLELSPHQAIVLENRGACYANMKQYPSAIRDYSAALAERNVPATVHLQFLFNRGNVYFDINRRHEALDDLRAVINNPLSQSEWMNSDLVLINDEVAWILATSPDAHLWNGDEAVRYASRALSLANKDDRYATLVTLAAAEARKGDYQAAVKDQLEAIATNQQPEHTNSLNYRLALYRAGKPFTEKGGTAK